MEAERTILITGASRGLGRAVAVQMASPGTVIFVNFSRSSEAAERTVDLIHERGGVGVPVQADVGTEAGIDGLFDEVRAGSSRLDVFVHNAYAKARSRPSETDGLLWQWAMDVGPLAFLRAAQRAVPMMSQRGGHIIATSSSAPHRCFSTTTGPSYFPMAIAKGAIEVTARYLAVELGRLQISVNVVAPGYMRTDNFPAQSGDELLARITARTPLGRVPDPEEVAKAIVYLASPDGAWITGQTITADGGFALI